MLFRHDPGNPLSLSHNHVTSIAENPSGDLWIGTEWQRTHEKTAKILEDQAKERTAELYNSDYGRKRLNEHLRREIIETEEALQKAYHELNQRVDELAMLNRITQMVASMSDLQAILRAISQELAIIFNAKNNEHRSVKPRANGTHLYRRLCRKPELPGITGTMLSLRNNHALYRWSNRRISHRPSGTNKYLIESSQHIMKQRIPLHDDCAAALAWECHGDDQYRDSSRGKNIHPRLK